MMSLWNGINNNDVSYDRILDKMESHYQGIINISNEVSSRVQERQDQLRQLYLQQMISVTRREREVLAAWRKIVLHNTHPWYYFVP